MCLWTANTVRVADGGVWMRARAVATSIVTLVAVPILVEFLIAFIKGENYSVYRAAVIFGALIVVAAFVYVPVLLRKHLQLALELVVLACGMAIIVAGAVLLASGAGRATRPLSVLVAVLAGLVVVAIGYLMYAQQRGMDLLLAIGENVDSQAINESQETENRVLTTKFASFMPADAEILRLCRQEISPDDIHFIGYYVDGKCRFHVDVLEDAGLNRFFRRTGRKERRIYYERIGRQIDWIIQSLNKYLSRLDSGVLIRTILDVEKGSISYYYLDENVYLVGITMDQSRVLDVDEKLRLVVNEIGLLPRGWVARTLSRRQVQQQL